MPTHVVAAAARAGMLCGAPGLALLHRFGSPAGRATAAPGRRQPLAAAVEPVPPSCGKSNSRRAFSALAPGLLQTPA